MNTVKVKICGIRTKEAAQAAIDAGADFLGFNFVPESKRYIHVEQAKSIIQAVRGKVPSVGVFRNAQVEDVIDIGTTLQLDYVQLHGDESPLYCQRVNTKVIKVFSVTQDFPIASTVKKMKQYRSRYYMLDRKLQGKGNRLDEKKVHILSDLFQLFLAGGLASENVAGIVESAHPFGVDVASGIETNGEQDLRRISAFIQNAKGVHL